MSESCLWTGVSGKQYLYYVYPLAMNFHKNQNGNYIYAKTVDNAWHPVYIGQGGLRDCCCDTHPKARYAVLKGATRVHAHLNATEAERVSEEADLLANYQQAYAPIGCNEGLGG